MCVSQPKLPTPTEKREGLGQAPAAQRDCVEPVVTVTGSENTLMALRDREACCCGMMKGTTQKQHTEMTLTGRQLRQFRLNTRQKYLRIKANTDSEIRKRQEPMTEGNPSGGRERMDFRRKPEIQKGKRRHGAATCNAQMYSYLILFKEAGF